jgi:hypothetical protein
LERKHNPGKQVYAYNLALAFDSNKTNKLSNSNWPQHSVWMRLVRGRVEWRATPQARIGRSRGTGGGLLVDLHRPSFRRPDRLDVPGTTIGRSLCVLSSGLIERLRVSNQGVHWLVLIIPNETSRDDGSAC